MRFLSTGVRAVTGTTTAVGATTFTDDLSALLRSIADWIDEGGTIGFVLWSITVILFLWVAFDIWKYWKERRTAKGQPAPESDSVLVDYMTACVIANSYIDPDDTMNPRIRLSVRAQILDKFDNVVGARIGENYNGPLLHQWFQKNAARTLVKHQNEIV